MEKSPPVSCSPMRSGEPLTAGFTAGIEIVDRDSVSSTPVTRTRSFTTFFDFRTLPFVCLKCSSNALRSPLVPGEAIMRVADFQLVRPIPADISPLRGGGKRAGRVMIDDLACGALPPCLGSPAPRRERRRG
jgi:hypothetical protein